MKLACTFLLVFVFTIGQVISQARSSPRHYMEKKNPLRMSYRSFSQPGPRIELGMGLGVSNAMTDVASSTVNQQASVTDVYSQGFAPAGTLFARYKFNDLFATQWAFSFVQLHGNDRWSPNREVAQRSRQFKNNLWEFNFLTELYLPRSLQRPKKDFKQVWMDYYVFTGLGIFHHSPEIKGPIIDEYDENLLASANNYTEWQLAVPLGVGTKLNIFNQWILGFDVNFRFTFFDHLDGFNRPYSTRNDYYFTSQLKLSYVLDSRHRNTNQVLNRYIFGEKSKRRSVGRPAASAK